MIDLLSSTEVFMEKAGQLNGLPLLEQLPAETMTQQGVDEWDRIYELRQELIREEHKEYLDAEGNGDYVEMVDGLLDKIVVEWGTLLALVGPEAAKELAAEVSRSNLDKVIGPGLPKFRDDGKVIKPEGWRGPDIVGVLMRHGLIK